MSPLSGGIHFASMAAVSGWYGGSTGAILGPGIVSRLSLGAYASIIVCFDNQST
jgi:hypothetical protein